MSLVRIAARIAAVQALMGKTLVGDNVLDSQIGALEVAADGSLRTDRESPFISVYADGAKSENQDVSLRAFLPNGQTEFLFEFAASSTFVTSDEETGASVVLPGIPATDANFEFFLDVVARQIGDVLTDPQNEWSEIFRKLVTQIEKTERARTSGDGSGVKLAAQQIKLTAMLVADPARGAELRHTHGLAMFFAKAANVPELMTVVDRMQQQLAGTEFFWQTDLRRYGMTRDEGDALLLTTPDGAEEDIEIVEVDAAPAVPAGDSE